MDPEFRQRLLTLIDAAEGLRSMAVAMLGHPVAGTAAPKAWPPRPEDIDLDDDDWLTPQQAAGVAHTSVDTIYARCGTGEIAIKIGGRLWVSRERLMTPEAF